MKKLILLISLFAVGSAYGQSFTFNNNSAFEIFTDGFIGCTGGGVTYVLASGTPSTMFFLGTGNYGYSSTFGFKSGGIQYLTPNPIGDNSLCFPPTGLNLTETASGGGNSVTFTWSVDLSGNVTVDAF